MIRFFGLPANRVPAHLLFWLVFMTVNGFVWGYCGEMQTGYFQSAYLHTLAELPLLVGGVYLNLYVLVPRFFATGRYTTWLLLLAGLLGLMALGIRGVLFAGFGEVNNWQGNRTAILDPYYVGKIAILNVSPVLLISSIIKLWKVWYAQQQQTQELQKARLDAELKFLKAQLQPHFLFNTLNNLYSLTLQKSDQAPQMLLKLADLMSYMLYEAQEERIPLEKEIRHIQHYIDLESLRYGGRVDVTFAIMGSPIGKLVAPLVLMPFVENAFKHGARRDIEKGWIRIELTITDETLWVKVENSLAPGRIRSSGSGVGLVNVQRRLALLYPEQHELALKPEPDKYAIDLKLSFM